MRKKLLLFLLSVVSLNCFAQISFEKGYYIDNSGKKTHCLIKNLDWKNNPTEFSCKLSVDAEADALNLESVKEVGVYGTFKYIRATVDMDRSSEEARSLSKTKDPVFKKETLFLKVLSEGKACLYAYTENNLYRYFYLSKDSGIKQLVYKSYVKSNNSAGEKGQNFDVTEGAIRINSSFKSQLWNCYKNDAALMKDIKRLKYNRKSLLKYFEKLNGKKKLKSKNKDMCKSRDAFNLYVRLGLSQNSLSMKNENLNNLDTNFDNKKGIHIGLEAEFIMPFNKNKWAFIIEPNYQYYKAEKDVNYSYHSSIIRKASFDVDYKSLEIPLGLRHYLFLNNKSKLFVNAAYVIDIPISGDLLERRTEGSKYENLEISNTTNFEFGFGYNYKDKYSVEMRYAPSRDLLTDYPSRNAEYKTLSIIFGFNIF